MTIRETTHSSRYSVSERGIVYQLDLWLSLGLFLLTLLTRLPFRSQILYHWDSVNFAYALEKLDIARGQPHAPGYIGYVWLGRLVDVLFADPQVTLVWLSVVGSGLAVVALYLMGCRWRDRCVGLVAALFLASSPLFWFYGEIALPHVLDGLFVILSTWMLFEIMEGRRDALIPAAAVLAVAGGLRQQTPVFLAPLALYAGYFGLVKPLGWKKGILTALPAAVLFGLLCATWFFPLINSAGGVARYLQILGDFSKAFNTTTSIFMQGGSSGLIRNLRKLGPYALYAWSAALPLFALYAGRQLLQRRWPVEWRQIGFLIVWVAPPLAFYTLIHMGQQGLVFVFLPALLLVSAEAAVRILKTRGRQTQVGVIALLVAVNAGTFLLLPEYPLGDEQIKLLTRKTLVNQDNYFQSRLNTLRANFAPEHTIVVADNWRHVMFYLPDYVWLPYEAVSKWGVGQSQARRGQEMQLFSPDDLGLSTEAGPVDVVFFDPSLQPFNRSPERTMTLPLSGGDLFYFSLAKGEYLSTGPEGIRVVENP